MKKLVTLAFIAVIGMNASSLMSNRIQSESDLTRAVAQSNGQPTKVLFTMAGCSACDGLKSRTRSPRGHIVSVESGNVQGLIDRYGIQYFPTVVTLDRSGKEIDRAVGAPQAQAVLEG